MARKVWAVATHERHRLKRLAQGIQQTLKANHSTNTTTNQGKITMTDKTLEQLQAEISSLTDKNAQLIAEKRKVQGERDEFAAQLSTLQAAADATQQSLEQITVHNPRMEIIDEVAAGGRSAILWRELNHHLNIERTAEGVDVFTTKDGDPVLKDGEPVTLSREGIYKLESLGLVDGLATLIVGNGSSGGGAHGNHNTKPLRSAAAHEPEAQRFGMR